MVVNVRLKSCKVQTLLLDSCLKVLALSKGLVCDRRLVQIAKMIEKHCPGTFHVKKLPQLSMYVHVLHRKRIFVDSS